MGSALDNASSVENQNLLCVGDGRQSMPNNVSHGNQIVGDFMDSRNDQQRLALAQFLILEQLALDLLLSLGIER